MDPRTANVTVEPMSDIYRACYIRTLMWDWIGPAVVLKRDPRCPLPPSQRLASVRIYNAIADQRPDWAAEAYANGGNPHG